LVTKNGILTGARKLAECSRLQYALSYSFVFGPLSLKVGAFRGRLFVCLSVRPSVCHGCTVVKRCKIGPRLLLITNKKWRTFCRIWWKSLTLDDLEGRYALLRLNDAK